MARYKAIHEGINLSLMFKLHDFTVIYKIDYPTLNETVNAQKCIFFFYLDNKLTSFAALADQAPVII